LRTLCYISPSLPNKVIKFNNTIFETASNRYFGLAKPISTKRTDILKTQGPIFTILPAVVPLPLIKPNEHRLQLGRPGDDSKPVVGAKREEAVQGDERRDQGQSGEH
jgi:hypothetical protein